jgi:hypothetical protein
VTVSALTTTIEVGMRKRMTQKIINTKSAGFHTKCVCVFMPQHQQRDFSIVILSKEIMVKNVITAGLRMNI